MNTEQVNSMLLQGIFDFPGLFPRLDALHKAPVIFQLYFGLNSLPEEPGVILLRGARQYGKSTWLEGAIYDTVKRFGPGSALFLDGDHLRDMDHLSHEISRLAQAFREDARVKRLFIDEITAVDNWELGLKRVIDRGELRDILVVTTGSRATDLRRGTERLPGRKGKLNRTSYLFLPVPYREFLRAGGHALGKERALYAYILSGGSPLACSELIQSGRLQEWVIESVRDWITGECARKGRSHGFLIAVMEQLHRYGATPVGQTKLAREAGLANNTIAAGWIEFLSDLLCVGIGGAWDETRKVVSQRRPAKFPFINLLAASAWSPDAPRAPEDFAGFTSDRQGVWLKWTVAQELFRRASIMGKPMPEYLPYWQSHHHEIDFVLGENEFIEVKRGQATALDCSWFRKVFPHGKLTVICSTPFTARNMRGVTLHDFLLEEI